MEKRLAKLEEAVGVIRDNHLAHLKDDLFEVKEGMASTKTNVDWLMRFFWVVAGSSVGALVTGIITLVNK